MGCGGGPVSRRGVHPLAPHVFSDDPGPQVLFKCRDCGALTTFWPMFSHDVKHGPCPGVPPVPPGVLGMRAGSCEPLFTIQSLIGRHEPVG